MSKLAGHPMFPAIIFVATHSILGSGACMAKETAAPPVPWNAAQWRTLQTLSITKLPAFPIDPSNRYLPDPAARRLGESLFVDTRLSANGHISCASCHQKDKAFSDGKPVAHGLAEGKRNAPGLINSSYQRWFFWDGRKDSLWAQTLGPLENPAEHGFSRTQLANLYASDRALQQQYRAAFGTPPLPDTPLEAASPDGTLGQIKSWKGLTAHTRLQVDTLFANTGKALAAYVATLRSTGSRFDTYLSDLEKTGSSSALNENEIEGLKHFIDPKQGCIQCHSGPLLSNLDFQNTGTGTPGSDHGRSEVIGQLRWDRFNCRGDFSDATPDQCDHLKYLNMDRHASRGSFKVPGLRNVARTAPYMHDGRYATLQQAITHYNDASQLPDTHLPPMSLTKTDIEQLANFLTTLNDLP